MESQSRLVWAAALTSAFLLQPSTVDAAKIRIWTARALATVLADLGSDFERATGHELEIATGLPGDFSRRADAGEVFDVVISASSPVGQWVREGRLLAETRVEIARSGIGVAVRTGARKPDLASVEAFKRALIEAKSIAYLRVGSGLYLEGLLERLGIAREIQSKATRPETDVVCELVARGEIELGIVVITQILTTPGVELAGPLPPEIQSHVVFAGGVGAASEAREAAREVLDFLAGPEAAAVMRAQGMEPVPGK
jgi:molybdate transport system substrate-binding protein